MHISCRGILLNLSLLFSATAIYGQLPVDTTQTFETRIAKFLETSQLSSQIFIGYQYLSVEGTPSNEFVLKRGYLTFRKNITPFLSGRITPDITIDQEGDGEGDVEMRLKYCFMELKHPDARGFFTEPSILVGQVFTPWIEFEEKINQYRVEGAHFLDRIKQLSSADFGVTITTLLGGKMDTDYQKRVNKNHAGKYGSIALGVYNGGGYHALEKNCNKTVQGRITLRPLPKYLSGFQLSGLGVIGKGNIAESPDWSMLSGFISYEHEFFALTGQVYSAEGNHEGSLTDEITFSSLKNKGYSLFSEIRIFNKKASLIGRYDYWEVLKSTPIHSSRYIFGMAYHISGKNKLMVDYNILNNSSSHTKPNEKTLEVMFELAF